MEKKATIISLIFICVIIVSASAFIIFTGITASELNYVQIEVNPRIEFLCDKKQRVVSYNPLNEDARILLAGVNYKGMDIEQASTDFIDLCAKAGYIDVNGVNNAVNITIIDGITQALDVHVTQKIYDYLRENEIMCAVVENYEDRSMFDAKKENNVCCPNKYKLIQTIIESNPDLTAKELNKLSEVELIDMVSNIHSTSHFKTTENDLILKTKLIDFNREKYDTHKKLISKYSLKEFSETFDEYQKLSMPRYATNFNKEYNNWQEHIISWHKQ